MRNVALRLRYLNTWFLTGDSVRGSLGDVAFLEELSHWLLGAVCP